MKLLLAIAMIFTSLSSTYSSGELLSVVTNYAYLYSSADFTSEKIIKISNRVQVELLSDELENNFYYVSCRYDEKNYNGYIFSESLAKLAEEQEVILTYNAKTSAQTKLYARDNEASATEIMLKENTELYLYEGYSSNNEFTAVKFSYNGEIILGYVRTIDVSPYGVSNVLIISITAIVACVGIIFILLGISKKKNKKSIFKKKEKAEN